jgi:hypothetical protein
LISSRVRVFILKSDMNIKDSIRDCYGKFIGSMDWNIFGTFTHLIPRTEKWIFHSKFTSISAQSLPPEGRY